MPFPVDLTISIHSLSPSTPNFKTNIGRHLPKSLLDSSPTASAHGGHGSLHEGQGQNRQASPLSALPGARLPLDLRDVGECHLHAPPGSPRAPGEKDPDTQGGGGVNGLLSAARLEPFGEQRYVNTRPSYIFRQSFLLHFCVAEGFFSSKVFKGFMNGKYSEYCS